MNYTSSHLTNKRLQEQSKDIGSICNTLDNMIDRVDNILLFIDNYKYKNKKYKRRKFVHSKTGLEYELSHFTNFKDYRNEIIKDYREYLKPYIFMTIMTICMISFAIYMCFHS